MSDRLTHAALMDPDDEGKLSSGVIEDKARIRTLINWVDQQNFTSTPETDNG